MLSRDIAGIIQRAKEMDAAKQVAENAAAEECAEDTAAGQHAECEALEQPAREANIAAICAYIAAGCKPGPGKLGIELEQHIVREDLLPVAYDDVFGSRWILEQFIRARESGFQSATYTPEGALIGAARAGATLTLEPAAQLELSAGPYDDLSRALDDLTHYQNQLDALLAPLANGPCPWATTPPAGQPTWC